jgi:hypothetical protein
MSRIASESHPQRSTLQCRIEATTYHAVHQHSFILSRLLYFYSHTGITKKLSIKHSHLASHPFLDQAYLHSSSHTESRVCDKRVASCTPKSHGVSAPSSIPRRAPTPPRRVGSSIPYHASSQPATVGTRNLSNRLQDERFSRTHSSLQSSDCLWRAPDRPPPQPSRVRWSPWWFQYSRRTDLVEAESFTGCCLGGRVITRRNGRIASYLMLGFKGSCGGHGDWARILHCGRLRLRRLWCWGS